MRTDLETLKESDLDRLLAEQGDVRKAGQVQSRQRWIIGLAVALPVLAIIWLAPELGFEGENALKVMLPVIALSAIMYWAHLPIRAAKLATKSGINSAIADELGFDYSLEVKRGEEWKAARIYGLVPGYNKSSFEDCWSGELEGHAFKVFEANLSQETGGTDGKSVEFLFGGAIVSMAFGRRFRSTTLLLRKGARKGLFGFDSATEITKAGHRLDLVTLADQRFADMFDIYSDDQVEAHRLIHPSYIERLIEIEHSFDAGDMKVLFHEGMVVIALETHDLFESGGMDPSKDKEKAEQTIGQISALARLALAFNQDERGGALG